MWKLEQNALNWPMKMKWLRSFKKQQKIKKKIGKYEESQAEK